jgi:hypothetical protein
VIVVLYQLFVFGLSCQAGSFWVAGESVSAFGSLALAVILMGVCELHELVLEAKKLTAFTSNFQVLVNHEKSEKSLDKTE